MPEQPNHDLGQEPQGLVGAEDAHLHDPDHMAQFPDLVGTSHSASISRRGSAVFSTTSSTTASFPSGSVPSSFASPRKVPFFRRMMHAFGLFSDDPRYHLLQPSYGPYIPQYLRPLSAYPPGYGKLAAFEACNPNFLIYRKFLWLHNRLLLKKQDELYGLEQHLQAFDNNDLTADPGRLKSRRRDEAPPIHRKELLQKIEGKLEEYDALLLRTQKVHAIAQPTKRNQTTLNNFICSTDAQLGMESDWIQMGPDLAAIARDGEDGWFIHSIVDLMMKISKSATKAIFQTREERLMSADDPTLYLLSPHRLDAMLRMISTFVAIALLLLPVFILSYFQQSKRGLQFLTIIAFTLAFSIAVSVFTRVRRQELFAATAAYCAVLVVFLGK